MLYLCPRLDASRGVLLGLCATAAMAAFGGMARRRVMGASGGGGFDVGAASVAFRHRAERLVTTHRRDARWLVVSAKQLILVQLGDTTVASGDAFTLEDRLVTIAFGCAEHPGNVPGLAVQVLDRGGTRAHRNNRVAMTVVRGGHPPSAATRVSTPSASDTRLLGLGTRWEDVGVACVQDG